VKKKELLQKIFILIAVVLTFFVYWIYRSTTADLTPPEITVVDGIPEISVLDDQAVLLQGVTAKDNRDGDVTDSILVENVYGITADNLVTVTYAAFDRAGNVSKTQRQVRYVDYEPTRFTLNQSLTLNNGSSVDIMNYLGAEDILDGNLHRKIRSTLVSDTGSLSQVGTHQILVQVTNSLGYTAELTLPVEVHMLGTYNANLELREYMVYLETGDTFNPKSYLSEFSYTGHEVVITNTIPSELSLVIDGSVNTSEPGVYPVYYTVSTQYFDTVYSARSCLIVVVTE